MKKILIALVIALSLTGCMGDDAPLDQSAVPTVPPDLETNEGGEPSLAVYNVKTKSVETMSVEDYVLGVVAGEMKNDWPEEALKAQAILARTYVMHFVSNRSSKYQGSDISTDVTEAQAYAPESINDRVRSAVRDTRGMVLSYDGEFVYAWFHAHSGGRTELASVALDYKEDPPYIRSVSSTESSDAPEDVKKWSCTVSLDRVVRAARDAGLSVDAVETVEIGEKGESGRAKTLLINGKPVSAPAFRIQLDASLLKSTLIHSISVSDGAVTFTGSGFGHGVGMSQWGAYGMAQDGKNAEEIITHYFDGADIVRAWE